jgi:predicted nucleotidyltransferase
MTDPVPEAMRARIAHELARIEAEEDVRILLAVESGSRAWGFHSPDSDFDVRFVYLRPVDWHLGLTPGRDVIERPLDDVLDVSGWDLRKTLTLMLSGNAVIGEWLGSPVVYRHAPEVEALSGLARRLLRRKPATWHYVNLLDRQWARVRRPDGGVKLKALFYAVRPALTLRWMRLHDLAFAPMDMAKLEAGCALDARLSGAIAELTALKLARPERGLVDVIDPAVADLIETEAAMARAWLARHGEAPAEAEDRALAEALHVRLTRAG